MSSLAKQAAIGRLRDFARNRRINLDAILSLLRNDPRGVNRDPYALVVFKHRKRFQRLQNARFIRRFECDVQTKTSFQAYRKNPSATLTLLYLRCRQDTFKLD